MDNPQTPLLPPGALDDWALEEAGGSHTSEIIVDPASIEHLKADEAKRKAFTKSHTRHDRILDRWPIWNPEIAVLLSNFNMPIWVYDLDNHR